MRPQIECSNTAREGFCFHPKILSIIVSKGRVQKSKNAQHHDEVAMNPDESQRRVDQSGQRPSST